MDMIAWLTDWWYGKKIKNSAAATAQTMVASQSSDKASVVSLPSETDEGALPANDVRLQDALGKLQQRLQDLLQQFTVSRELWIKKKKEILTASSIAISLDKQAASGNRERFLQAFKKILEEIKEFVEPIEWNLDDQIAHVHPHLQALCAEIDTHLNALPGHPALAELKAGEKHKPCLEICNEVIELFSDLIALINDVTREIERCLQCEKLGTKVAIHIAKFAFTALTGIELPEIDPGIDELYRKSLFHRIIEPTGEITNIITDSEGMAEKAKKKLEEYDNSVDGREDKSLVVSVAKLSFLTKTPSVEKITVEVQAQPALQL